MNPTENRRAPPDSWQDLLGRLATATRSAWRGAIHAPQGGPYIGTFVCAACGHREASVQFGEPVPGEAPYQLLHCGSCGLVQLHPLPDADAIRAFYDSTYYGEYNKKFGPLTEVFILLFRLTRLRALRLMRVRDGVVLDLGCGRGQFLRYLERLGYDAWGTELTDESAVGARRWVSERVRAGPNAITSFPSGQFRAITAWQVFEHLREPRDVLRECHRLLERNGVLILSVPNLDSWQAIWAGVEWFHLDLPRHIFHYTPAVLQRILAAEGFTVELISHYSLEQNPFGFLQSALQRLGYPRMGLYSMLRGPAYSAPQSRLRRLLFYMAYLFVFPFAAAIETVWSLRRAGATCTILARKTSP